MTTWTKLGQVCIDSGQILFIDPAYVDDEWKANSRKLAEKVEKGKGQFGGGTYEDCCNLTLSKKQGGQLKFKRGHMGLGVCSRTGWGDGVYPVYALIKNNRVMQVVIQFITEKEMKEMME